MRSHYNHNVCPKYGRILRSSIYITALLFCKIAYCQSIITSTPLTGAASPGVVVATNTITLGIDPLRILPVPTTQGGTVYYNGTNWVTNGNLYNNGGFIGIGTTAPAGHLEINYCNDAENGLVVTRGNCGVVPGFYPTFDGEIDQFNLIAGQNSGTTFELPPVNFSLGHWNSLNAKPLIWGRTENPPSSPYGVSSGVFTTRFIVTPYGTSGINVEAPRATLDVKCLGTYNDIAAIFGRQVPNTANQTRHIMIVPLTSEDGYNQMVHKNDQGIFFTDGLGTNGANGTGALVIAPWASDHNSSIGGLRIDNMGNLEVAGSVHTTEVNVTAPWWSDYVFDKSFALRPLSEVESYMQKNKHLPDVPSEKELKDNGLNLADMQAIQMQKIEELYLYVVQLKKENEELKKEIQEIKK